VRPSSETGESICTSIGMSVGFIIAAGSSSVTRKQHFDLRWSKRVRHGNASVVGATGG
jgi:hypothetical protein